MNIEVIIAWVSLAAFVCLFFGTFLGERELKRVRSTLATVEGQLAAANREIAMMRKARSDASRKGAVTKRAKRIHLPGGAGDVSRVMDIELRGGGL